MSDKENTQEENIQVDEAFGELLANFVRKNPCLYDKKCKEYKDILYMTMSLGSMRQKYEKQKARGKKQATESKEHIVDSALC